MVACLAGLAACDPAPEAKPPAPREGPNLFADGGFEAGGGSWFDLSGEAKPFWHGFDVTDRFAKGGKHSAHLRLEAPARADRTSICGVVQEVRSPIPFPARISGWYRVENWRRALPKQYLQFVVIVWGSDVASRFPNVQIRYVLAGAQEPPLKISNAKYVFIGDREPATGEWVRFERDLRKDWADAWGAVPGRCEKIRALFEARYDDREGERAEPLGDVYYDDLYLGP